MPDILRIKRRAAGGAAGPPSSLVAAEIAYNEQDNTLYYGSGNSGGLATSILPIGGQGAFATLASPVFTGNPTAPTPTAGDNDTSIATTAFVQAAVAGGTAGVASFNTRTGIVVLQAADLSSVGGALLASPIFTGNPTAPTATAGDNDTSLATTAFAQAAVAPALNNVGRNLLHNSLFNVQQRGVGGFNAVTTGWTWSADRWGLILGAAGDSLSHLMTAINDTQRGQIGDESATWELACNFTGGAAAANSCLSKQSIENVRRLAGKTVTLSFYALAAASSPKLGVSLDQFFGSGGSPSADVLGAGQSVTISSTTWARYSLTFALPSISGKTLGTAGNDFTALIFWHSAGSNSATRAGNVGVQTGTHLIWGVQLEVGTVATPLEKPDPQQDVAKCQRFYQASQIGLLANSTGGSFVGVQAQLCTAMRAAPTVLYGGAIGTDSNSTSISAADQITPQSFRFVVQLTATGVVSCYRVFSVSADL